MTGDESSRFKIRLDDDREPDLKEDVGDDIRISNLSRRLNLVAVLIPLVFIIIMLFVYMSIQSKVSLISDTGRTKVQKISSDLESRVSALSIKVAKLKDYTSEKLNNLDKRTKSLSKRYARHEKALKKLSTAKADKKALAKTAERLASLKNKLEAVSLEITKNMKKGAVDIHAVNDRIVNMDSIVAKLKSELSSMMESKVDKKNLDMELEIKKIELQEGIKESLTQIHKQIDSLGKKLQGLENKVNTPKAGQTKISKAQIRSIKQSANKGLDTRPSSGKKGIIEQNITE